MLSSQTDTQEASGVDPDTRSHMASILPEEYIFRQKKYRPSVKKKRKADRQKFTTAHPLFKDVLSHCEKTQDVVVVVVCDIIF